MVDRVEKCHAGHAVTGSSGSATASACCKCRTSTGLRRGGPNGLPPAALASGVVTRGRWLATASGSARLPPHFVSPRLPPAPQFSLRLLRLVFLGCGLTDSALRIPAGPQKVGAGTYVCTLLSVASVLDVQRIWSIIIWNGFATAVQRLCVKVSKQSEVR